MKRNSLKIGLLPALILSLAACTQIGEPLNSSAKLADAKLSTAEKTAAVNKPVLPSPIAVPDKSALAIAPSAKTPSSSNPPSQTTSSHVAALTVRDRAQSRMAGFSTDGKHYLLLESWRDPGAGIPNAMLQIVDVVSNTCLVDGCITTRFGEGEASLSAAIAEDSLLQETRLLRQDLQIEQPRPGTSLAILARSRSENGSETIKVQVGNSPELMEIRLKQKRVVSTLSGGTAPQDAAAMQLQITYGGKQRSLNSLKVLQDGVMDFSIREVQLSPNGKRAIVLLDATQRAFEGKLKRTLVQGFTL